ncbi:hypothetical protein BGW36DRAFT_452282 [Talaromyces proteolyticus]|uniref:HTH CENPB-type domain-containing protein n=1 Tax=Talaromyces proteolyticus TaxID=1131652 RepID=A0AAD4KNA8_9EURO|nr:uncharacterized protein BGW36DRAFT_452282 [Talaromyces proteolyticus]KAH8696582.1 hypothetical protein BGW36DRAFT_452282 [Talaromyces proteolyticus]
MTPKLYKEEEELISKAPSVCQRHKNPNFSKLAREYRVSHKKLSHQWNGLPSRSTHPPTNRLLSLDQEKAFFLWLKELNNIDAPSTNGQIKENTNYLLVKDLTFPREPSCAGKTWIYNKYIRVTGIDTGSTFMLGVNCDLS